MDLQKVLKKAGITKEALDKARSLRRTRDFRRDLSEFKEELRIFQEEVERYRETGRSVNDEGVKSSLKEAELLRVTLDGRKVKKRFLGDKLKNLRKKEARLEKRAKKLNLKFKKELDNIKIE